MTITTLSSKGWVVIPVELRKKYGLHPGARVALVDYGGVLAIVPAMSDSVKESAGIFKGGASLTKALLRERAEDLKREG